jgi:hypothetical protein
MMEARSEGAFWQLDKVTGFNVEAASLGRGTAEYHGRRPPEKPRGVAVLPGEVAGKIHYHHLKFLGLWRVKRKGKYRLCAGDNQDPVTRQSGPGAFIESYSGFSKIPKVRAAGGSLFR